MDKDSIKDHIINNDNVKGEISLVVALSLSSFWVNSIDLSHSSSSYTSSSSSSL